MKLNPKDHLSQFRRIRETLKDMCHSDSMDFFIIIILIRNKFYYCLICVNDFSYGAISKRENSAII